jgi:hypothetical protein
VPVDAIEDFLAEIAIEFVFLPVSCFLFFFGLLPGEDGY